MQRSLGVVDDAIMATDQTAAVPNLWSMRKAVKGVSVHETLSRQVKPLKQCAYPEVNVKMDDHVVDTAYT